MKRSYKPVVVAVCLAIVCGAAFLVMEARKPTHSTKQDGRYTYLNGTVTEYNTAPTAVDGPVIFKIDGKSVNIGGGWPSSREMGEVYSDIKVGDKVQAKVIASKYTDFTVFDCNECYVKKQSFLR